MDTKMMTACDAMRENELSDAGRDYCNAFVREHMDRFRAAGIRIDEGFHNMLFSAFRAGARFETSRQTPDPIAEDAATGNP